jgi:CheY-like chemotaxis protein
VLSADSGASALSLLSEATPDLILLDVIMPGMDGYAVCAELGIVNK